MAPFHKLFPVVLIIFFSAFAVEAQTSCTRYSEPGGGFSVCTPEGWTASSKEGEKFKHFFSPAPNAGSANINFEDEDSKLSLVEYVTAANTYTLGHVNGLGADSIELISRTAFVTASHERGERLIYKVSARDLTVRTTQFLFAAQGTRKIVMTFTVVEPGIDYSKIVEASAATFRLEN